MSNAIVKPANGKHPWIGTYVEIKALDGIRAWEGTLIDMAEQGPLISYDARGFPYQTQVSWPAIASIDTRIELDAKATKTDKPDTKSTKTTAPAAK